VWQLVISIYGCHHTVVEKPWLYTRKNKLFLIQLPQTLLAKSLNLYASHHKKAGLCFARMSTSNMICQIQLRLEMEYQMLLLDHSFVCSLVD
jgi:hypothetical protein